MEGWWKGRGGGGRRGGERKGGGRRGGVVGVAADTFCFFLSFYFRLSYLFCFKPSYIKRQLSGRLYRRNR